MSEISAALDEARGHLRDLSYWQREMALPFLPEGVKAEKFARSLWAKIAADEAIERAYLLANT